nr:reverse transcriptase domain-containing protein [Tanacetum cinerariifolium]
MSAMANTTSIVTTVMKPATNPRDADATPRVNIQDFCEEYYEDILPIIMDKVRRDKRKEVHARLNLEEGSRERKKREGSHYSSARTLSARPERLKVHDHLRYNDRHVLDRLGHQRQSVFDRLSETYSPSTTKSRPGRTSSRDSSRGRSRPHRRDAFNGYHPKTYRKATPVMEGTGNQSKKRHKPTDEDDLTMPLMCEEVDPFTPRIRNFKSPRRTRMPNNVKTYDETGDPEDHIKFFQAAALVERWAMPTWCHMFNSTLIGAVRVWFDELPPGNIDSYKDFRAAFLSYFMHQKKYIKDLVQNYKIKQKDGETIKDFMERFKVETERMKRPPECMRIYGFMLGVNNPELTKCLNDHVPKTMEEMMITTTAFIRGEAVAASEKKGLPPYKDTKRNSRGRGRKVPAATTYGDPSRKEKRQQVCDFHNDKRHSTDEISWKVESLCGYPFKFFLDAYKGYRQIQLAESDEEKTAFHTGQGVQIGRNIEVYIDNLVIKSHTEAEMLRDIGEMFHTLRKINMKLNPKKCTFGAVEGMFLGYMITPEGIKLKQKLYYNYRPHGQSKRAISAVLMTERGMVQMPVYFVTRALQGPKLNYTPMENLVLSLVFVAKRLRRAITKMESHAGRTQYHIPAKDVGERTGPSGFPCRMPEESPPNVSVVETQQEPWTLFTDGSSCVDGADGSVKYTLPQSKNKKADALSKIVSTSFAYLSKQVLLEILKEKSIQEKEVTTVVEEDGLTWMTPIMEYLKERTLPIDRKEARKLRINPTVRIISGGSLQAVIPYVVVKGINIAGPFLKSPGEIVSDNGKQFCDNPFKDWCDKLNITQRFASVKHVQSNGLVERANQSLEEGIKARLGEEAVIPTEIGMPTYRIAAVDVVHNDEELRLNLDLLEERRKRVAICEAKAKLKMIKYYNARVRSVTFRPSDFVYRSNDASHAVDRGKLRPK